MTTMIEQPCHQCNTALHLKKNGCMVSMVQELNILAGLLRKVAPRYRASTKGLMQMN